jgi:hypothetical protein
MTKYGIQEGIMRRFRIIVVAFGLAILGFVGAWIISYPSPADPKNMGYVFWKAGFYKMNLDEVTEAMVGDGDPEKNKIVIGRTESELRGKFGYLLEPSQASPYLSGCYQTSYWKDQRVLFIRKSQWMVVFHDGRASDLVLMKGC